jgi:hypothetical protein
MCSAPRAPLRLTLDGLVWAAAVIQPVNPVCVAALMAGHGDLGVRSRTAEM